MKLLAIDPASKVTGYAVLNERGDVIDAQLIRASRSKLPLDRIASIIADLNGVCDEHSPSAIVVEVTSGRPGTGSTRGASSSLAIYGMAVGAIWWAMRGRGIAVHPVDEDRWTARYSKAQRQLAAVATVPGYSAQKDKGGDVSDAIALGRWWLDRQRFRERVAQ